MEDNLVSIIMPAYNAEKFIAKSIESVLNQTYQLWELLIVDDCSVDSTRDIVESYILNDPRVKFYRLNENSGAAVARKVGIEKAQGRYIAFLDSDDIWLPEKLKKQIAFMLENNFTFTCTCYGKINENGEVLKTIIDDSKIRTYKNLLKNCPGNSTVIYDAKRLGKIYPVNIRKRNDYVLWLQVIKKSKYLFCYPEILGYHRLVSGSISSNKIKLIRYHWNIYRKVEKLNFLYSGCLVMYWCMKGIKNQFMSIRS